MNKLNIQGLKKIIRTNLVPIIDSDYVLLDIPNHCNIGDNLIWEGELEFLRQEVPHKCLYSSNYLNYDDSKIEKADIILLHGGGNWGDLYRECQVFRNYIASKYLNKKIVVFPQTVWYNNDTLIEKDCQIYERHPNCYICVRDQESYDTLRTYINCNKLLLLPDMAFYVNVPRIPLGNKKLFMVRTDHEVKNENIRIIEGCELSDWPTFSNNRYVNILQLRFMILKRQLSSKLQNCPILNKMVDPEYGLNDRNSRLNYISKGYDFISKYNTIYTTRLHGMILGILMGLEVYIVDNKYNKCRNFYNTWLKDFKNINFYHG